MVKFRRRIKDKDFENLLESMVKSALRLNAIKCTDLKRLNAYTSLLTVPVEKERFTTAALVWAPKRGRGDDEAHYTPESLREELSKRARRG